MTASGALHELADFFTPLAKVRRTLRGAALLHHPGHPILGANAAYVFTEEGALRAHAWFLSQDAPTVLVGPDVPEGAEEVLALRVGTYRAVPLESPIVVEQVSRLELAVFSEVLGAAWEVPEWSQVLAHTLSALLERRTDVTLFVAYGADGPVGALLGRGEQAHLWGAANSAALLPLLNAAAEVSGGLVRTSVPDVHGLALRDETRIVFSRRA